MYPPFLNVDNVNKMKSTNVFNVNPGKQGTPINFFQNQKVTATNNIELKLACYERHWP
jgi:hypothetical protein